MKRIDSKMILKIVRNKYFMFVVILFVFNISLQISVKKYKKQLNNLVIEKNEYKSDIVKLKQQLKDLSHTNNIEKFARENFNMKAKNEDVFVIKK